MNSTASYEAEPAQYPEHIPTQIDAAICSILVIDTRHLTPNTYAKNGVFLVDKDSPFFKLVYYIKNRVNSAKDKGFCGYEKRQ